MAHRGALVTGVETDPTAPAPALPDDAPPAARRTVSSSTLLTAVFAVALVATGAYLLHRARGLIVMGDDIHVANEGRTLGGYFEPYNQALAVVPIALYQIIYRIFGFGDYTPLAVMGVVSQLAVPLAMFLVVRSRVGATCALLAGMVLLWYPGVVLFPAQSNHFYSVAAIIVCSWAVRKPGTKFDVLIAAALLLALGSSGVALAGVVGCTVYIALARSPLSRWCAVLGPVVLWGIWSISLNRERPAAAESQSLGEISRYVYDGVVGTFRGLAFENRFLGAALAIAFVGFVAWRLRDGLRAARHTVAWTLALVVWFAGLSLVRGSHGAPQGLDIFGSPDQFRYRIAGAVFIMLACLPDGRSPAVIRWTSKAWPVAAAIAVSALFVVTGRDDIEAGVDAVRATAQQHRVILLTANLGPGVIPDDQPLLSLAAGVNGRQWRELVAEFGAPDGTTPEHPDAAIVDLRDLHPRPVAPREGNCVPLSDPVEVGTNPRLTLQAGAEPVTVRVRRFEDGWTTIGTIPAGSAAQVGLPELLALPPWYISAPGACRVGA